MMSSSASSISGATGVQAALPVGQKTVKELLDWAVKAGKPPKSAPLPHTKFFYRLEDGTTYNAEALAGMEPGENADLANICLLAKAGIKQQDSPRAGGKEIEKKKKATFVIQVSGGPKAHHAAAIAVATSNVIQEAVALRGLSEMDCT